MEKCRTVQSMEQALSPRPDIAIIASPTAEHIPVALDLARRGVHLLIEKPLSHTLDGVDELIRECQKQGVVLLTGYNFRFYRPLQIVKQALNEQRIGRILSIRAEVGQYLPDWRPTKDYRSSASAVASCGGGVVLELSHELDYVLWLAGDACSIFAQADHVSDLEVDVEDIAEIILQLQHGGIASIHLDMVARAPYRACQIIGTNGTLCWDGIRHEVREYLADTGVWTELVPAHAYDRNAMYREELVHFLDCVAGKSKAQVAPGDARRVLQICLAAKESARQLKQVSI